MGKHGFAGFSAREMQMIEWRTHGIKTSEIAVKLGLSRRHTSDMMGRVMRKVGVNDVALLTRWAMVNGMDEGLPPESAETREIVRPKVYKKAIRLGRLRRAGWRSGSD
jgi:DNA-binding CsgD family transcriptional regulator